MAHDFRAILQQAGINVPEGQELGEIASRLSDQALHLEHLHEVTQQLVDSIAILIGNHTDAISALCQQQQTLEARIASLEAALNRRDGL